MGTLDDEIARHLAAAAAAGELAAAPSYGKPMGRAEGWDATPEALRLPFKILKDAGFAPPELALFHERAELRAASAAATDAAQLRQLQRRLGEVQQKLALRLEALRVNARV